MEVLQFVTDSSSSITNPLGESTPIHDHSVFSSLPPSLPLSFHPSTHPSIHPSIHHYIIVILHFLPPVHSLLRERPPIKLLTGSSKSWRPIFLLSVLWLL